MKNTGQWFDETGQALVEFALILSLLTVVLFGLVQFAFFLGSHILVSSAAREGVRIAAVGGGVEAVRDRAESVTAAIPLLTVEREEIQVSPSLLNERHAEGSVAVTVPGSMKVIVPFFSSADAIDIEYHAKMHYELLGPDRPRMEGYVYILNLNIDRHVGSGTATVSFDVINYLGEPIPSAEVTMEIENKNTGVVETKGASSGEDGQVVHTITGLEGNKNTNPYGLTITDISAGGLEWEGHLDQVIF